MTEKEFYVWEPLEFFFIATFAEARKQAWKFRFDLCDAGVGRR